MVSRAAGSARMAIGISGSTAVSSRTTNPAPKKERAAKQRENRRRQPRIVHAAKIERQHERRACRHHQHRAEEVEPMRPAVPRQPAQGPSAQAPMAIMQNGNFPQKDHPPIQMIANPAAEHRAAAAGGGECDREVGVVFGALFRAAPCRPVPSGRSKSCRRRPCPARRGRRSASACSTPMPKRTRRSCR